MYLSIYIRAVPIFANSQAMRETYGYSNPYINRPQQALSNVVWSYARGEISSGPYILLSPF